VLFIYNILVTLVGVVLKIIAFFNAKTKLFVNGRKGVFKTLTQTIKPTDKVIWLHTASLGEFEQGLPIVERLKINFPAHKIVATFFSPSGYEVKKNSNVAHVITYLPLDTKKNAKRFLDTVRPDLAIFVKYEFWPNYLKELQKRNITTLLVSAIFRKQQAFFKGYGGFMKKTLATFNHFFVQDENSKNLLQSIGFNNVTVSGDTRFDRVSKILNQNNTLPFIKDFVDDKLCVVAGSTWPEDEALLTEYINTQLPNEVKFIFAPHNIKPQQIGKLKTSIHKRVMLFSEKEGKQLSDFDVLIVDTIGLLTKIYSYASIAYVGGGVGTTGLHNTLEPAVFGIPIIIGSNYQNFKEAIDLVALGGILSISNQASLNTALNKLIKQEEFRKKLGEINGSYVKNNTGATQVISEYTQQIPL
jgi:3-deoxy-D-manno-octulosonic-acid transferase